MSHTPGPWTYDEESNEVYHLDSAGHVEACLCEIRGEPNWRDNARLVCAAPELLEALQGVLPFLEELSTLQMDTVGEVTRLEVSRQVVREAIRKALGQ